MGSCLETKDWVTTCIMMPWSMSMQNNTQMQHQNCENNFNSDWDSWNYNLSQQHEVFESDMQGRERCNTWPRQVLERSDSWNQSVTEHQMTMLPPSTVPGHEHGQCPVSSSSDTIDMSTVSSTTDDVTSYGRRNPWGPQSYAELITQAISSSPKKKMTLNQIYDWLTNNIQYFSERTNTEKSAGWKNSIRHNLSLHQKFKKVPNESSGKSSWWVLDLEASPSKKSRRRSTAGDMKSMIQRRDKARASVAARRVSLAEQNLLSNIPEEDSSFLDGDFHPRDRCNSVNSSMSSQSSYTSFNNFSFEDFDFLGRFEADYNRHVVPSGISELSDLRFEFSNNLRISHFNTRS